MNIRFVFYSFTGCINSRSIH